MENWEVVQKEQGVEGKDGELGSCPKGTGGGREGWGSCPKGTGVRGKDGEVVQMEQWVGWKGWEVVQVYTSMNEQDTSS